jgi:hypothetical protein
MNVSLTICENERKDQRLGIGVENEIKNRRHLLNELITSNKNKNVNQDDDAIKNSFVNEFQLQTANQSLSKYEQKPISAANSSSRSSLTCSSDFSLQKKSSQTHTDSPVSPCSPHQPVLKTFNFDFSPRDRDESICLISNVCQNDKKSAERIETDFCCKDRLNVKKKNKEGFFDDDNNSNGNNRLIANALSEPIELNQNWLNKNKVHAFILNYINNLFLIVVFSFIDK